MAAVDVATRSIVDGYLRHGACASGHGLGNFIRKLMAESHHPVDQTVFHLGNIGHERGTSGDIGS